MQPPEANRGCHHDAAKGDQRKVRGYWTKENQEWGNGCPKLFQTKHFYGKVLSKGQFYALITLLIPSSITRVMVLASVGTSSAVTSSASTKATKSTAYLSNETVGFFYIRMEMLDRSSYVYSSSDCGTRGGEKQLSNCNTIAHLCTQVDKNPEEDGLWRNENHAHSQEATQDVQGENERSPVKLQKNQLTAKITCKYLQNRSYLVIHQCHANGTRRWSKLLVQTKEEYVEINVPNSSKKV